MKLSGFISDRSDWIGMAGSGICVVHCMATPVFFAGRAFYGAYHDGAFWKYLDYLFIAVSLAAIYFSARHSQNRAIRVSFYGCWAAFSVGLLFEEAHPTFRCMAYAASFALIGLHYFHLRVHSAGENW